MGSSISGSLSNLFIDLMEKTIIKKFIKEKTIVHYQRYADDVLCICLKDSVDKILNKMNGLDHHLSFTVEKFENNELKFLDAKIFIENGQINFRKFFRKAEKTVFTNLKLSITPYKYKVKNIYTQIHRTRDCCSDEEQFRFALDDVRLIFANSY